MSLTPKGPTMTDAELMALAALANVEAVIMSGDNAARLSNGYSPAWASGCGYGEAGEKLRTELWNRGVLT